MKKIFYLIGVVAVFGFASCGNGTDESNGENTGDSTEVVILKGYEELDLTEWGFPMSVMVPNAELNGDAEVSMTDWGALQIKVGQDFGIEIIYGEGDIELLKMDLEEDLVFESEILVEEQKGIMYKQDIPDSGVKTQFHFFYAATIGNEVYEVKDLMDGEYGKGMIEKMMQAAKTLKAKEMNV